MDGNLIFVAVAFAVLFNYILISALVSRCAYARADAEVARRQRDIYIGIVTKLTDMPTEELALRLGVETGAKVHTTDALKRKFGIDNESRDG